MLGFTALWQLWLILAAVMFFHGSEYVLAIAIHGKSNVSLSSLLISKQYLIAMVCGFLEYILEIMLFPELKEQWWICNTGLLMVVIGEIIRKTAVLTARCAFTHMIRIHHEEHHELVTHGIYRFIRHPGYCGFFIWATGTQMMLCNPVCTLAFTMVTWRFFSKRIAYFWPNCRNNLFRLLDPFILSDLEVTRGEAKQEVITSDRRFINRGY